MLDGKGSFNVFHDISGINRALGESEKTLELFKQIETNASARPERLWIIVQDLAFEHKEFELINRYIEDIEQEYRLAYSDYIRDLGLFTNDEHLKWVRRTFKKETDQLVLLAEFNGEDALAEKIRNRAKDVLNSKDGIID